MMSCRIKVAVVVGMVCVGASIAALTVAVILLFRFTHTLQHDAAGATSDNHVTTDGNCVMYESIVGPSMSKLLIVI